MFLDDVNHLLYQNKIEPITPFIILKDRASCPFWTIS